MQAIFNLKIKLSQFLLQG